MPAITEQDLRAQMESGKLACCYVLFGEEKLLVKRAAKRLIRLAGGESFLEFNCNEFPGEAAVERIADAAAALPFMAERKCVAVADLNVEERSSEELERLWELLGDLPETTTLVLHYPTLETGGKPAKWKKLLDCAGKAGYTVNFGRREPGELRRTLTRAAERQGCVLQRSAGEKLLEYCGQDLNLLLGEVEKLCAYTLGRGEREITPQRVEEMTPKSTETTVFMMVKALTAGQTEKAYALLDDIFYQNEEPVAVLGAMAASYVDMYRVRAALESGLTSSAPAEYAPEYKKLSFRLRNGERAIQRVPTQTLEECLRLLLEADLALKSSRMDSRLILETLMARLMQAMYRGGQS